MIVIAIRFAVVGLCLDEVLLGIQKIQTYELSNRTDSLLEYCLVFFIRKIIKVEGWKPLD